MNSKIKIYVNDIPCLACLDIGSLLPGFESLFLGVGSLPPGVRSYFLLLCHCFSVMDMYFSELGHWPLLYLTHLADIV